MELPTQIKSLYKHWEKHTHKPQIGKQLNVDTLLYKQITQFINERLLIYEKKNADQLPPYTSDPILSKYRFCNIYRELDRQTIEFHTLLKPLENNFSLWLLNMLFCRTICNPETVKKTGLISFEIGNNQKVYDKLIQLPSPKYGNAYVFPISIIQRSQWNTREKFFCFYYPHIMKVIAEKVQSFDNSSVTEALQVLLPLFGFNLKFLFTELLIDVAYQFPEYVDLYKRFPIGPGSLPTMRMIDSHTDPEEVNLALTRMSHPAIHLFTFDNKSIHLSAENWEGIGCEFRKYTNLENGSGRKRKYTVQ